MPERPRCLFWDYADRFGNGRNCEKPATRYRFHGDPGDMNRLGLYCGEHTYRDSECREITPEILDRAYAEGWPFFEWPPPTPLTAEQLTAERIADWIEEQPAINALAFAEEIRKRFGGGVPCP